MNCMPTAYIYEVEIGSFCARKRGSDASKLLALWLSTVDPGTADANTLKSLSEGARHGSESPEDNILCDHVRTSKK